MNEAFGDLRSRCHAAPSEGAWELVCDEIDRGDPARRVERALPYARAHLSEWPDEVRVAPRRWLNRLARGEQVPELCLAGTARLDRGHGGVVDRLEGSALQVSSLELRRTLAGGGRPRGLVEWEGLSRVVNLSLMDCSSFDDDAAAAFAMRGDLGAMRSLELSNPGVSAKGVWFLLDGGSNAGERSYERLMLTGVEDAAEAARVLSEGLGCEGLRVLGLSGWSRGIATGGQLDWEGLGALTRGAQRWPELEALVIRRAFTGARVSGEAPNLARFGRLESLDIGDASNLDRETWEEVTRGGLPPELRELSVSWSALGLESIARTLEGTKVTSLDVSDTPVDLEGMEELRSSGVLGRLRRLKLRSLAGRGSVGEALRALVRADALALEELYLGGSEIEGLGFRALARAPLGELRELYLPRSGVGVSADELREASWGQLEVLRVEGNGLSGEDLASWSEAGWFRGLEELSWGSNEARGRGLQVALEAWEGGRLRRLDLSECGLGDEDARRLSRAPALANLEELDLSRNGGIGEEGRACLVGSEWLPEHIRARFLRMGDV